MTSQLRTLVDDLFKLTVLSLAFSYRTHFVLLLFFPCHTSVSDCRAIASLELKEALYARQ